MRTPKRAVPAALFVLLAASLAAGRASAGSGQLLGQPVRIHAAWPDAGPREGYLGIRFELENQDARPRQVRLSFEGSESRVIREVSLAAGERRPVSLTVPASSRYGSLRALVDGGEWSGAVGFSVDLTRFLPLLVEGRESAAPLLAARRDGETYGEQAVVPLNVVAAAELPDSLAELVGYPAVALLEARFDSLPQAQQRALEAYASTGGVLYLREVPSSLGGPAEESERQVGFGRVVACGSRCAGQVAALPGVETLRRPVHLSPGFGYDGLGYNASGEPLLDLARAPAGGFLSIVLLFTVALVAGSFVVRRRFGPPALLLFIPATATVACLGIAGYGVAREGLFTIHAAARAVTLLDTGRARATTLAVEGFYATMAPRAARFGRLEAPLLPEGVRGLVLEQDEALSFSRGLIPARTYRELLTLAVAPSRARLSVRDAGGEPVVENALGARVTEGVIGWKGQTCRFADLGDGQAGKASCGVSGPDWIARPIERHSNRNDLESSALAPFGDGEFVAMLDRAVFVGGGGLELERRDDRQLVRGRWSP